MRVRRLIVAASLAFATVGLSAGTAHAAIPKANEECIKKLESATATIDDCQQAPSPLKPENSELVWGSISFAILLGLFFKFGYPAVTKSMKAREERIRGDLEGAEGAKGEAEGVLAEYRAQLADARTESGRIIDEARQAADQVRRDLIAIELAEKIVERNLDRDTQMALIDNYINSVGSN